VLGGELLLEYRSDDLLRDASGAHDLLRD
jgi:hypothetical protein